MTRLQIDSRRVTALAQALGKPSPVTLTATSLAALVDVRDRSQVWLALAVLTATLPSETTVIETARAALFDPTALAQAVAKHSSRASKRRTVRVEVGRVLVDVAHTASVPFLTGIQRVVRETVRRWLRDTEALPVAWTDHLDAFRDLTPAERRATAQGLAGSPDKAQARHADVVVPWKCRYILPELAIEPDRIDLTRAFARLSGNTVGAIGYDMIPLTTSETTAPGMPGAFALTMTALRYADVIVPISQASADEYQGWVTALTGAGITGPTITAVELPQDMGQSEMGQDTGQDADQGTGQTVGQEAGQNAGHGERPDRFFLGDGPLVLVVGSHEPRKNHSAILQAAETLWAQGHQFTLTFVGGRAWGAEKFLDRLAALQQDGRSVQSISQVSDSELAAAYRAARFTVFPSFNEGYGLPVAESLDRGTPAITSNFGSMAGIAAAGGCLLVDPRNDASVTDAMRQLLTDNALLAKLEQEAAARPRHTWDQYAASVWDLLGTLPNPAHQDVKAEI